MYRFFKSLRANYLISAVLCVLFGISLVVWPDISSKLVCIGFGCVLALTGAANLITFFVRKDGSLLSQINMLAGIVLLVLGGWIIFDPSVLMRIIPVVIGAIIAVHGGHNVLQAAELYKEKYDKWWVALLLGIVTIGFGALLIYNPFEAVNTMIVLIGVMLIYDGISDIWIISRVSKTVRAVAETMEALEVEAVEVPDKK